MNLNQVTLPVRDLTSAVAFYQRLGLRLIVEDLPHCALRVSRRREHALARAGEGTRRRAERGRLLRVP